jgi:hypothetical protein
MLAVPTLAHILLAILSSLGKQLGLTQKEGKLTNLCILLQARGALHSPSPLPPTNSNLHQIPRGLRRNTLPISCPLRRSSHLSRLSTAPIADMANYTHPLANLFLRRQESKALIHLHHSNLPPIFLQKAIFAISTGPLWLSSTTSFSLFHGLMRPSAGVSCPGIMSMPTPSFTLGHRLCLFLTVHPYYLTSQPSSQASST